MTTPSAQPLDVPLETAFDESDFTYTSESESEYTNNLTRAFRWLKEEEDLLAFKAGDQVLVYYGPHLYKSSIRRSHRVDSSESNEFFVHYEKFSRNYDEWVDISRILPLTESNLKLMRQLNGTERESRKRSSSESSDVPLKRSRRKSIRSSVRPSGQSHPVAIDLILPQCLLSYILHDWEYVNTSKRSYAFPCDRTVTAILKSFVYSRTRGSLSEKNIENAKKTSVAVSQYFEQCLGTRLLYKCEKPQFQQLREEHSDTPLCDLYGAIHLLRLLYKLPEFLSETRMSSAQAKNITSSLSELVKYLERNTEWFASQFEF